MHSKGVAWWSEGVVLGMQQFSIYISVRSECLAVKFGLIRFRTGRGREQYVRESGGNVYKLQRERGRRVRR